MKNKLTKNAYWIKSGLFTLFERASIQVFNFGTFFILVRYFDKATFGIWVLFTGTTAFIEVARNGLIQNATIKYLSGSKDEEYKKIVTASYTLNIILTLGTIVLLFFLSVFLAGVWDAAELETMFKIYMATTFILIFFSNTNFIGQANFTFDGIFYSNFTRQGIFFLLVLVAFLSGFEFTVIDLAKAQILTACAGGLVSVLYHRRFLNWSRQIDWTWVKKLFAFGRYVFGTNIGSMLFKNIDRWMLGALIGPGATALYDPAIRVSNLVEIPAQSVASIVFPKAAARAKEEGLSAAKYLYEKSVGVILSMIIPVSIFVLIFPQWVIRVIAGEAYIDAAVILQITIFYTMFVPFSRQFGTVLDSVGKPQINFYTVCSGALLNVMFNYIFITKFGIVGAAYGTLTTFCIMFVVQQVILAKVLNVQVQKTIFYAGSFYKDAFKMVNQKLRPTKG